MLHKYEHSKKVRTKSWRRYQEERVVKHRLTNDKRYRSGCYDYDGDIDYGRVTWVNLIGKSYSYKARTSFSYRRSRWYYEEEYNRTKYKRFTQRLLWEEGLVERIGHR